MGEIAEILTFLKTFNWDDIKRLYIYSSPEIIAFREFVNPTKKDYEPIQVFIMCFSQLKSRMNDFLVHFNFCRNWYDQIRDQLSTSLNGL